MDNDHVVITVERSVGNVVVSVMDSHRLQPEVRKLRVPIEKYLKLRARVIMGITIMSDRAQANQFGSLAAIKAHLRHVRDTVFPLYGFPRNLCQINDYFLSHLPSPRQKCGQQLPSTTQQRAPVASGLARSPVYHFKGGAGGIFDEGKLSKAHIRRLGDEFYPAGAQIGYGCIKIVYCQPDMIPHTLMELPRDIHRRAMQVHAYDRHSAKLQFLDLLGPQRSLIEGHSFRYIVNNEMPVIKTVLYRGLFS